jgi:hypothetical protein
VETTAAVVADQARSESVPPTTAMAAPEVPERPLRSPEAPLPEAAAVAAPATTTVALEVQAAAAMDATAPTRSQPVQARSTRAAAEAVATTLPDKTADLA